MLMLDWMSGKGHGALLRRAELKTFVNFHGNEAGKGGDLTHDETTIIAGALELTEKTAKDAMTPISKTFALDLDGVFGGALNLIMTNGHSRVPVYVGNPNNIVGIILVKSQTIDPKDAVPLRKMTLRKILRVSENMPLYDILNEFQKGNIHIAVVISDTNEIKETPRKTKEVKTKLNTKQRTKPETSSTDGSHDGEQLSNSRSPAISLSKKQQKHSDCILDVEHSPIPEFPETEVVVGVITMEDVIEKLLQEEILDETDEYINIHNRIKVNMQTFQRKWTEAKDVLVFCTNYYCKHTNISIVVIRAIQSCPTFSSLLSISTWTNTNANAFCFCRYFSNRLPYCTTYRALMEFY